jgi:hypothetical protein
VPKEKLSPEEEIIAAYGAAMIAAFQVLINCLEEDDAKALGPDRDLISTEFGQSFSIVRRPRQAFRAALRSVKSR